MDKTMPNPPGAGDAGLAFLFAFRRYCRGAPDLDRFRRFKHIPKDKHAE
jgi:hypothetical protein